MSVNSQSDSEEVSAGTPQPPSSSSSSLAASLQRSQGKDPEEPSESESKKFLSSIPPVFFEEKFNAAEYLKTAFPPDADDVWLESQIVEKGIARELVQKELANRILESYDSFVQVCFLFVFVLDDYFLVY